MHAEHFRSGELRQCLDVRLVVFHFADFGTIEKSRRAELIILSEDFLPKVRLQQAHERDAIFGVGHPTTVVAVADAVVERVEGRLVGVLVDEDVELLDGDAQVGLVELVSVDPAEGAEQSSFLEDGVEEEEAEE